MSQSDPYHRRAPDGSPLSASTPSQYSLTAAASHLMPSSARPRLDSDGYDGGPLFLDDEQPHSGSCGGSDSGSGSSSDSATEGGGGVLVPHYLRAHMTLSDNGLSDVPFVLHAATVTQLDLSNNQLAALGVEMCSCGHRHVPLSPITSTTILSSSASADSDSTSGDSSATATSLTALCQTLSKHVRFADGVQLKYFETPDRPHQHVYQNAHDDGDEDRDSSESDVLDDDEERFVDSPLAPYVCASCTCRGLPTPLSQLVNLRVLDVCGNRLRALGPEITHLRSLQTLLLGNNELDDSSLRVSEADWARLTRLTELVYRTFLIRLDTCNTLYSYRFDLIF